MKLLIEEKDGKLYRESFLINDELNPKLINVLKKLYEIFTEGENKMYPKGIAKFINGVSSSNEEVEEYEEKVQNFLKENDKEI